MRVIFVALALVSAVWALPQADIPSEINFADFPMKNLYVNENGVVTEEYVDIGSRILNGHEVAPHSIPSQVWFIFRVSPGGGGWSCGGTLITRRFALTAAHCVVGAAVAEVYIGAHNVGINEPNRIILSATRFIGHPAWDSATISNDIGLVDLQTQVTLNQYVGLATLPSRSQASNLFEGANSRVSGWGLTSGGGSRSNVLLAVNSTVLPNPSCRAVFSIFIDSEICISGQGGVGSCNGDSGGPLIHNDRQIGVVSYGLGGCPLGYPSVFARVTSYIDWIAANSDYVFD